MQLNGFDVWITICDESEKDVPLTEYSVRVESEKHATCWIPSSAGHRFAIHWRDNQKRQTKGNCVIDGVSVGGKYISHPEKRNTTDFEAYSLTTTTRAPFQFAQLELTDDDSFYGNGSRMGVIEVRLSECRVIGRRLKTHTGTLPHMTSKVHERSKKGLVHGVCFGNIEQSTTLHRYSATVDRVDPQPTIFTFRYRPIDVLQADGIAPPSPAPPQPSKSEANESTTHSKSGPENSSNKRKAPDSKPSVDLSDEDDDVALLEAKLARAKAKRALLSGSPHKRVKEERNPAILAGTFIDLT